MLICNGEADTATNPHRIDGRDRVADRACAGLHAVMCLGVWAATLLPFVASAQTFTTIYDFYRHPKDPAFPYGPLTVFRGAFYGRSLIGGGPSKHEQSFGTIYKVNANTGDEKTLFRFQSSNSSNALTQLDGSFYGATQYDGENGYGTIYKFDPLTRSVDVLYNFALEDATHSTQLTASGGLLYGTAQFSQGGCPCQLFSFDPSTNTKTVLHEQGGAEGVPLSLSLLVSGGRLYGTAYEGGANDAGTIFQYDIATGTETTLYDFRKKGDVGPNPADGLLLHGNSLFGLTEVAHDGGTATIFRFDLDTGKATLLHDFATQGVLVTGPPAFYDGALYAPMSIANSATPPSIFKLDVRTRAITTEYMLPGTPRGDNFSSPLLLYGGDLYGTTYGGGAYRHGTLFRLTP